MDAGQISLWVSLASFGLAAGSFIVAIASASYSRRQALAAEATLKRKDPIFELTIKPGIRTDGWKEAIYTARNYECVRLEWIRFEVKHRQVTIRSVEDAYTHDGYGNLVMPETFSEDRTTRTLEIGGRVSANKNPGGPTSVYNVTFAFHGPLKAKDVKHTWKWADE